MELDFDKEIDALLRKETAGRTITISEFAGGLHLDADEIAAFAEKKVPPGVRLAFVEHFAACDKCRKILLNAAWLTSEAEPVAKDGIVAPAVETVVPWYRRLFLFPNLAYVMGGLVVVFTGFIGLSVITYWSAGSDVSMVKQGGERQPAILEEQPSAAAPSMNANANVSSANMPNAANSVANVSQDGIVTSAPASNTMSNSAVAKEAPVSVTAEEDKLKDAQPRATPAPPAPPAKSDNFAIDGIAGRRMQELPTTQRAPDRERDKKAEQPKAAPENAPVMRNTGPMPKMKGPMRNETRERNLVLENEKKAIRRADAATSSDVAASTVRKTVGGRTFELRQGAWYDTTYSGQGTVNVRRNTEDYRKLDRGLRGIAENFIGAVVVTIWNGRAYRIQ